MFDTVEKHRGVFKILLVLIAASFVTFGVQTMGSSGKNYIVQIGSQPITEQDIGRTVQNLGGTPDEQTRRNVYALLSQRAYLIGAAKENGVAVSDEQVKQNIVATSYFWENGAFSKQKFAEALRSMQRSEAAYVEDLKSEMYLQSLLQLFQDVLIADVQAENFLKIYNSAREFQSAAFRAEDYAQQVEVSDTAVQAYYDSHQAAYTEPQAVQYEAVTVDSASLAQHITVGGDELKAALAAAGEISDEEKSALKQKMQQDKAARRLAVVKEEMAEASLNYPQDLAQTAKVAQAEIKRNGEWLTREAAAAALPEIVAQTLFEEDVLAGNASDALEADGSVWVVRVREVRPERLLPLAEIRSRVEQDYHNAEAEKLAQQAAQAALTKLEKGEDAGVKWSEPQNLPTAYARATLSAEDFQKLMAAVPQEGKPAYTLYADQAMPVLVRVNRIIPGSTEEAAALIPTLSAVQAQADLDNVLRYAERTVKSKKGLQKAVE